MRKFLTLLTIGIGLMAVAPKASSQVTTLLGTSGLALDTITNADATSFKTGKTTGNNTYMLVKFEKLTGTVAGSIVWEGSLDNTTFYTIATVSLTDASLNTGYHFVRGSETLATSQWLYQRVTVTTTGTSTARASCKMLMTN